MPEASQNVVVKIFVVSMIKHRIKNTVPLSSRGREQHLVQLNPSAPGNASFSSLDEGLSRIH